LRRKYSIIIIPPGHNQSPRQFSFSLRTKKIAIAASIVLVIFLASLFIHDRYQTHYIKEYRQKIAYVNQLESEIQAKNTEIARLNEKTAEINETFRRLPLSSRK
jgi:hypothetical protein